MRTSPLASSRSSTFTLTALAAVLSAALLAACGGGGSSSSSGGTSGTLSTDVATSYSANATAMSSDTTAALDTSVATAETAIAASASAGAAAEARSSAQSIGTSAPLAATTHTVVDCPGGGTATLTISGGTAATQLNGKLDAGESYQVVFANCRRVAGAAAVNGTLGMTVQSASSTDVSLSLTATDLSVALAQGGATLNGSADVQRSSTTDSGGTTQTSSHFTSSSITLGTQFNARHSSFALTAIDITRQANWIDGVEQSSSLAGTYTMSATLPIGSFSYTVSTQGSVSYSSSGTVVSGTTLIALSNASIAVTVSTGTATIAIDEGKDGTVDRSFTVSVSTLSSTAG